MKSKEWWQDKSNAQKWIEKCEHWEKQNKGNSKNFKNEEDFLFNEIIKSDKLKILEVGAGNGRIIGRLSNLKQTSSIDINSELSNYVSSKYYNVETHVGEITNLPFKDNEFDLVYTHEVLQHIDPEDIEKACSELLRVGKEVWCMENWRSNEEDGKKVSDSHCGRWNYDLKKRIPIYYDEYTDWGQLFIKAKKELYEGTYCNR